MQLVAIYGASNLLVNRLTNNRLLAGRSYTGNVKAQGHHNEPDGKLHCVVL